MAEFSKLVITNRGQALIAKMIAGEGVVKFTRVSTSSKTYAENELQELDSLAEVKQTALISKIVRTNEVAVKLQTAFSNADLTSGYYMRALGLYANDPDDGEVLYAVTRETSGNSYMPPYNGITVTGAYITIVTTVGNAENVSIETNHDIYATIEDILPLEKGIERLRLDLEKQIKIIEEATQEAIESIESIYQQTTGYTDKAIAELINGAPATMDTLKEIADAMEKNQDVVDALEAAIGSKASENEFESHRTNNNIHVTTTEKQQIQAHQNFIQDFMNLFPGVPDHKKATYQLGGGLDGKQTISIYTAEEDCLVTLNGFVQYLSPPDEATLTGNLLINNTTIVATTLPGKETGSNIPIAANLRLNKGDSINVQMLCIGITAERGTTVNIHYFLKSLPLGTKSEMT